MTSSWQITDVTPKRVLFIDHTPALGGGEVALLNLLSKLDPARYRPVVALFADGPLAVALRQAGVETHIIPLSAEVLETRKDSLAGRRAWRFGVAAAALQHVHRVARFISDGRFDLVHCNSLKSDLIGGLAARLARTPVVWHVRDRIDPSYLPRSAAMMFRRAAGLIPDALIANSRATLDLIKPTFEYFRGESGAEQRTCVVHDGVPDQAFVPARPRAAGPSVIGLVGRISQWKGQDIFIRAAEIVLKRHPDARFRIIGAALFSEVEYERSICALAKQLNLENKVEFCGFRSDVTQAISELDILVHASVIGEPFGQVIIEGMAAGKPVIATRGGGVPEIIQDDINGLLVPMGDAAAMAQAIDRVLSDPNLAARLATAGTSRVYDAFCITHVAANIQNFFDRILSAAPSRPGRGVRA